MTMENKEEAKYIERIEIKGLWGRYDVDWTLNSDVNILVGENGTGKSTIMFIIYRLIKVTGSTLATGNITSKELVGEDFNKFHSCKLYTHHGTVINSYIEIDGGGKTVITERSGFELLAAIVDKVQTFDNIDENKFELGKYSQNERRNYIATDLDLQLDDRITDYVEYQLNQNKKLRVKGETYEKVFAKQQFFIATLNRLFSPTDKQVDEDENRLSFLISNNKIKPYQLSSGEKQLLIILLTVLCQDEKPSILLMDEPELSLHLRWQYELIEIIRTLNPNCQLIIATHSPSIYGKGWRDKVFFTNEIIKENKEQTV